MSEVRKAGDYTIIHEIHIGNKEVVVGELPYDSEQKYLCANYVTNGIIGSYEDCMGSDSYTEIMILFAERISEQAQQVQNELNKINVPPEDKKCVDPSNVDLIKYDDNIEYKVVVIRANSLRREYRNAVNQIYLCTGGFGSHPNSRGSACYCTNLYSGKSTRFERSDILGVLKQDKIPEWAAKNLDSTKAQKKKDKGAR